MAKTFSFNADTKLSRQLSFSYHITGTRTGGHSTQSESAIRHTQVQQQGSVDYNPSPGWQFRLSGEHYLTRRQGNGDLKYFFTDLKAKYRIKKW